MPLTPDGNFVLVLVQHLAGNMHTRWEGLRDGDRTGTVGERATRNRDAESEEGALDGVVPLDVWAAGGQIVLVALTTYPRTIWPAR